MIVPPVLDTAITITFPVLSFIPNSADLELELRPCELFTC